MEPLRRHFNQLDHTAWTGLVVLAVGCLGGSAAIAARLLTPEAALDVPAMGAYASIFMFVGIVLYVRGEG